MTQRKPQNKKNVKKNFGTESAVFLYGLHAVRAALANPKRAAVALYATRNAARELEAVSGGVAVHICSPQELAGKLPADAVHQGVVLEAAPLLQPSLDAACETANTLVVLDQISDPRNVGAILRAAAVFGAGGVIMTRRHSPPASGALAKTASGALESVPLIGVGNLARALEKLKQAGFFVVGLDENSDTTLSTLAPRKVACVMGAEGKGLRRLTRENCDMMARLTAHKTEFATLNVATAAAIALYALTH